MITVCGWCPTELPNDSPLDVQAHFSTRHGLHNGSQSLRFFYPDNVENEFLHYQRMVAARASAEVPGE